MADITNIKATDRVIEITDPGTDANIGLRINIMSIDDDRMKKIKRQITDRRLYLEARGKNFKADEIEENKNNILANAITGWEWYNPTGKEGDKDYDADAQLTFNGEVPDFTRKNVIAVLDANAFAAEQVGDEIGETKAFFNNSKPT